MKNECFRGNTIGNLQNEGLIADGGKWIYIYLNNGLYRINKQTNEKILLFSGEARYLNVVDNFIYYVDSHRMLYRIDNDGSQKEESFRYYEGVEEISIVDEWIYCSDSWGEYIFRINIDNFKRDDSFEIGTVPLSMAIDDKNIYFSDDQRNNLETFTLSLPVRKREGKEIGYNNSDGVFFINVENEWIYYLECDRPWREYDIFERIKYNIYKIKKDGSNRIKLTEDYADYLNVEDGWIYFSNISDGSSLYKIRIDGKQKIKLSDDTCENIHLVDDSVYYYVKDREIYRLFQEKFKDLQQQNLSFKEINKLMNEWENGMLIQSNPKKLYRIKKDGSNKEKVEFK